MQAPGCDMNATASELISESWNRGRDVFHERDLPPSRTRITIHMKAMFHEKTRPDDPGGFKPVHRTVTSFSARQISVFPRWLPELQPAAPQERDKANN